MDGFISYPRTDNTVYPKSLNTKELVTSLVRIPDFDAAKGLLDGPLQADPRQEGDHRPPADLPDPGGLPERARGPQAPRLRARRPPLPRHLQPADDHRVDQRRHRGRVGDLLRPRLGRRRPRLRGDLHLRPLLRRGDPGARRGAEPRPRRRPVDRRQGDPAAVADQPGQADRADGGARPGHQGHPRRHHPEALRPRLRVLEPARALGDRDRDVQGLQRPRAADGDARDDRRARARHGQDRRRRDLQGRRCSADQPRDAAHDHRGARGPSARTSRSRSGPGWTRTSSSARARSARRPAASARTARRTGCGSSSSRAASACRLRGLEPRRPRGTRLVPCRGPLPGRGYELWRLEERCSVCGETPEADGQGLPRPPLEALPQRRLPLDGRDARRSAPSARRPRRPREQAKADGRGQRRSGGSAEEAADAVAPAKGKGGRRRRPSKKPSPQTARHQARSLQAADTTACSSPSRESTAPARRPRRRCSPRRSARTTLLAARARRHRRPASGSASCSRTPSVELTPRAELMLFCAARAELVERGRSRPALEAGRDVVCDRFVDSTVAYQGGARGLDIDLVEQLNELPSRGCLPDLTVLLRVDTEVAAAPRALRARSPTASSPRALDFQRPGRGRLRRIAGAEPGADRGRRCRGRASRRSTRG